MQSLRSTTRRRLLFAALVFTAACDSPAAPRIDPGPRIASAEAGPGTVGTAVPVSVRVVDDAARPVAGVEVHFEPVSGRVDPAVAVSDSTGVARTSWTLGTVGLEQVVRVRLASGDTAAIEVRTVAAPDRLVSIQLITLGNPHLVHPATIRVRALARDRYGNEMTSFAHGITWRCDGCEGGEVAVVAPVPDSSTYATVSTKGAGQFTVVVAVPPEPGWTFEARAPLLSFMPPPGYDITRTPLSRALALNVHGEVVGHTAGDSLARWRNGVLTPVGVVAGAAETNARGELLFSTAAGAFILRDGSTIRVTSCCAAAFNDRTDVVGVDAAGQRFLWSNGELLTIPLPADAAFGWPTDINNAGQATMNARIGTRNEPFIWSAAAGHTQIPRPPSCSLVHAVALDDSGNVVLQCRYHLGSAYYTDTGVFLWNGSSLTAVEPLLTFMDINNRGEIAGRGPGGILLWKDGTYRLLFAGGSFFVTGLRLNDAGQVIVSIRTYEDRWQRDFEATSSYLLTPR